MEYFWFLDVDGALSGDWTQKSKTSARPCSRASFLQELRPQCRKIMMAPQAYRPSPELGEGISSCAYGNYVIFFTSDSRLLRIIRVLHGAMDIDELFAENIPPLTTKPR